MNINEYKRCLTLELEQISLSGDSNPDILKNRLALLGIIDQTIRYHSTTETVLELDKVVSALDNKFDEGISKIRELKREYAKLEKKKQNLEEQNPEIKAIADDIDRLNKEIQSFEELERLLQTQAQLKSRLEEFKSKDLLNEFPSIKSFSKWAERTEPKLGSIYKTQLLKFEESCQKLQSLMDEIAGLNEKIQVNKIKLSTSEEGKKNKETQLKSLRENFKKLVEKVEIIEKEKEYLKSTHEQNVEKFEQHFKSNEELWKVVSENYKENDIKRYVEEQLTIGIRKKLEEYDSVLKKIIKEFEGMSIEELPIISK